MSVPIEREGLKSFVRGREDAPDAALTQSQKERIAFNHIRFLHQYDYARSIRGLASHISDGRYFDDDNVIIGQKDSGPESMIVHTKVFSREDPTVVLSAIVTPGADDVYYGLRIGKKDLYDGSGAHPLRWLERRHFVEPELFRYNQLEHHYQTEALIDGLQRMFFLKEVGERELMKRGIFFAVRSNEPAIYLHAEAVRDHLLLFEQVCNTHQDLMDGAHVRIKKERLPSQAVNIFMNAYERFKLPRNDLMKKTMGGKEGFSIHTVIHEGNPYLDLVYTAPGKNRYTSKL